MRHRGSHPSDFDYAYWNVYRVLVHKLQVTHGERHVGSSICLEVHPAFDWGDFSIANGRPSLISGEVFTAITRPTQPWSRPEWGGGRIFPDLLAAPGDDQVPKATCWRVCSDL